MRHRKVSIYSNYNISRPAKNIKPIAARIPIFANPITALIPIKAYREEFKESFPELDDAKYFIRKPKAIEDLVKHVATILG